MIIEIKNKKVNLVLKTRKIVEIAKLLKNKNFEEAFVKAYSILDAETLCTLIYKLAETEDGFALFKNTDEVYDFIDECRVEGLNANELYKRIAEALNEEGFFKKKMSKKELENLTSNPLSTINMNELVQKSAENAMSKIAEQQFQGYKA
jgi:hypothetical protein